MQLYQALKSRMGNRDCYTVKMRMKTVANEVGFASEMCGSKLIKKALRKNPEEGQEINEFIDYLAQSEDRFFLPIVVVVLGGNPLFYPVEISSGPLASMFNTPRIDDSLGIVTFNGDQQFFALNGQHRLKAIKALVGQREPELPDIPKGFQDEEVPVTMLVRQEPDNDAFFQDCRRLISSLHQYSENLY